MRAASRQVNNLSGARVGALAALKLADEYFQLKKDFDELAELVKKR